MEGSWKLRIEIEVRGLKIENDRKTPVGTYLQ